VIDSGYNLQVINKNAGPITSFSVTPTSVINGEANTYTFAVQALIPIKKGDKFTMTLPIEMEPPVDADAMNC
jgi:hypothetical protein